MKNGEKLTFLAKQAFYAREMYVYYSLNTLYNCDLHHLHREWVTEVKNGASVRELRSIWHGYLDLHMHCYDYLDTMQSIQCLIE